MAAKHVLAVLFVATLGGSALAQQPVASSEFGRVSGGQLDIAVKTPAPLSVGFGLVSGRGRSGYEAMLGGTIVNDRLWFFASTQQNQDAHFVKMDANLGERQSLGATWSTGREINAPSIPSSFLSLRYTGIVSNNMFFSATVSRYSRSIGEAGTQ